MYNANTNTVMVDVTSLLPTEVSGHVVPYTFTIQVQDASGAVGSYSSVTASQQLNKYAFVPTQKVTGGMGGVSGADNLCMQYRPSALSTFTFKAMLVNDPSLYVIDPSNRVLVVSPTTTQRVASSLTNWVLTPNTNYFYPTGLVVNQTNTASVFPVDTNTGIPISTTNASGVRIANGWSASTVIFTGLAPGWKTLSPNFGFASTYGDQTCAAWQSNSSGTYSMPTFSISGLYPRASIGYLQPNLIQFWQPLTTGSPGFCYLLYSFLCVQQ